MPDATSQLTQRVEFLVRSIQNELALGRNLDEVVRLLRNLFEQGEIDQAVAQVKAQMPGLTEDVTVLTGKHPHEGWYQGSSEDPNSHWGMLKNVLKTKSSAWTDDMVRSLHHSSDGVVAYLAPPNSEKIHRCQGLVLGYIQSGKTANFSAVIAKAVDAGYRLVVVLSGMHNNLRMQTQARLYEEIVRPCETACTTLTRVDEKGDFEKNQAIKANRALGSKDGFTLVVLKKNTYVLRNFLGWLSEADAQTLAACPTLIIDDESDQASVNTNRPEENPTAINERIRKLISQFRVVSYVGYTATPFANVLIDASEADDLFPKDFLVSLEKPPSYFGPEDLFGRETVNGLEEKAGMAIIRSVPEKEALAYRATRKSDKGNISHIVPSLEKAINSFLLAGAARLARNQWRQHITMLVHTSNVIDQQTQLKELIEAHVLDLRFGIKEKNPTLKNRLETLWKEDFIPISKTFPAAPIPEFETILLNVEKILDRIDTVLENSASDERLSFSGPDPLWGIVVGGNTLSRGLTLEGLTVSYFVRNSKGFDTLLQMGRWFGYRPGYVDLTRLFVPDELREKFYHLATIEQEIRDEIKTMAANKERPIDVGLRIRTHPNMVVTSAMKMRTARECHLTYSGTKIQARYVTPYSKNLLVQNQKQICELFANAQKFGASKTASPFKEFESSHLFRGVSAELVLQFLDGFHFSVANIKFSSSMLSEYITGLTKEGELSDWSVALMSARSGTATNLVPGLPAFQLERSVITETESSGDPNAVLLRSLTAPGDELIDLADKFKSPSNSVIAVLDDAKLSGSSEVLLRRKYRPVERGLLLIYPLRYQSVNSKPSKEEDANSRNLTGPLSAVSEVFAVTFVFPHTENSRSRFRYIINSSI